ncbi:MAG TPA: Gfo/Idh/MocA family oxidoreductase, partial [Armatimonadetes bacterium]|nr:Gfo/Idh/MocA family oxidoreductase [Armatimonadota bacterium]
DPHQNFPTLYQQAINDLGEGGLVFVATPDHLHTQMVLDAIEAGCDVVCMKPLCLKVAEAHQIINKAREKGAYVFTEYHKRKDRAVRALRYKYRRGELGEVLYGHAWIEEPKYMPLEVFKDWCEHSSPFEYIGTHYADVYYYVTGLKPKRVVAFGQKKFLKKQGKDAYDAIQAVIEWEDGSAFWIQTSWVCSPKNSAMTNQGLQLSGTMGEYWADHKYRNLHFLTEEGGFDQYNPNFFKPYDSWDEEGEVEYVGYGYESNRQAIDDVLLLKRETSGLPPEEALKRRKEIISKWERLATRALPCHALIGVAINEAVRLSVDNGSRFVGFDEQMYPYLL